MKRKYGPHLFDIEDLLYSKKRKKKSQMNPFRKMLYTLESLLDEHITKQEGDKNIIQIVLSFTIKNC